MDKVLDAYKNLAKAVASVVYDSAHDCVVDDELGTLYDALDKLAALYGMDLELAATAFKEHNVPGGTMPISCKGTIWQLSASVGTLHVSGWRRLVPRIYRP